MLSDYKDDILNKTYLDLDTIKEKFQKEMFPNIKIINFCGSVDESCSHPQFHEIIKHFASWGCHINVATNGSRVLQVGGKTCKNYVPCPE